MSDHHVFRLAGVPYLFLSCGRWQHYHQVTDTPDRLNFHKMVKISSFVISLCRAMSSEKLVHASLTLTEERLSCGVVDTSEMEIDLLQAVFGESLRALLAVMGLRRLESRPHLDQLAARMQGMFSV